MKKRFWVVRLGGGNPYIESDLSNIVDQLANGDLDESLTIKPIEMEESEFETLPEFTGP